MTPGTAAPPLENVTYRMMRCALRCGEPLAMRLAIIGGSGGVGRWLLAVARENGEHVKTLVRDRRRLPADLGAIGVVEGDINDRRAVQAVVAGSDVVLSAIGADGLGATTVYSRSAAHIVDAMQVAGVSRLIVVSSAGLEDDPNMNRLFRRVLAPLVLRNVFADMRSMERLVIESGLVWTIVRPAKLNDGARTGLYRANERLLPERGSRISRADVADFMYRAIADERTIRKIAALAY
jgi:putative NADH-flavin reductase